MKNNKLVFNFISLISIFLSGCASFNTELSGNNNQLIQTPAQGFTYHLPAKIYDVEAKFQIINCIEPPRNSTSSLPALEYKVSSVFNEKLIGDQKQTYTINYELLNGLTKVSKAKFDKYPSGMLKSVNAESHDQTTEIVGNVIDAGFSIIRGGRT